MIFEFHFPTISTTPSSVELMPPPTVPKLVEICPSPLQPSSLSFAAPVLVRDQAIKRPSLFLSDEVELSSPLGFPNSVQPPFPLHSFESPHLARPAKSTLSL